MAAGAEPTLNCSLCTPTQFCSLSPQLAFLTSELMVQLGRPSNPAPHSDQPSQACPIPNVPGESAHNEHGCSLCLHQQLNSPPGTHSPAKLSLCFLGIPRQLTLQAGMRSRPGQSKPCLPHRTGIWPKPGQSGVCMTGQEPKDFFFSSHSWPVRIEAQDH